MSNAENESNCIFPRRHSVAYFWQNSFKSTFATAEELFRMIEMLRKHMSHFSHFILSKVPPGKKTNYIVALLQGVRTLTSLGMLVAVPYFTTKETQGLWYLFISIGALSSIAEMGFTGLFLVFAAHEHQELDDNSKSTLPRNVIQGAKFHPFSQFVLLWSSLASIILFPILLIAGGIVISLRAEDWGWFLPWLSYAAGISLALFTGFILAWYEGVGNIVHAYLLRAILTVVSVLAIIFFLKIDFGLWALPISLFASLIYPIFVVLPNIRHSADTADFVPRQIFGEWLPEITPLLKKNVGSFIGSYVSLQAATITVYLTSGTVASGAIGLTTNAWLAGYSVFFTMMASNASPAGKLWARGKGMEAWRICRSAFKHSFVLFLLVGVAALLLIWRYPHFGFLQRMTGINDMAVFFIGLLLNLCVSSIVVYSRSAKLEPLTFISLFTAPLCVLLTFSSKTLNISVFWGYVLVNFITLIYCRKILRDLLAKQTVQV